MFAGNVLSQKGDRDRDRDWGLAFGTGDRDRDLGRALGLGTGDRDRDRDLRTGDRDLRTGDLARGFGFGFGACFAICIKAYTLANVSLYIFARRSSGDSVFAFPFARILFN